MSWGPQLYFAAKNAIERRYDASQWRHACNMAFTSAPYHASKGGAHLAIANSLRSLLVAQWLQDRKCADVSEELAGAVAAIVPLMKPVLHESWFSSPREGDAG